MKKVISFPQMGNYSVAIEKLLELIFPEHDIMPAPPVTKRTLELGARYSPDFVCVPFKYTLGSYIEAVENGANVLLQAGGGCRYGYYSEIQELLLNELGHNIEFIRLISDGINPLSLYRKCRALGSKISFAKFAYCTTMIIRMVRYLDAAETYIRENIGFQINENSFEHMHKEFLRELKVTNTHGRLNAVYKEYNKQLRSIKVNKPQDCRKVGLVGELYTLMEPFSNYYLEKELAKNNIMISRYINVTFLLFEKARNEKKILRDAGKYLKYAIGADGTDSVSRSVLLAEQGYDGIIHVKPFGCTPEVNAMPMLQNISNDYQIPVIYFSFDAQTSETGVKTRLEAFNDMLNMRRTKTAN